MTRKTLSMSDRSRLKSPLLKPKAVAQSFGRLCHILIRRIALRLVRLVADRAALLRQLSRGSNIDGINKLCSWLDPGNDVNVFVVRKFYGEIRFRSFPFGRKVKYLARVVKRPTSTVTRRKVVHVANRADRRLGAAKELSPMTIQT